MKFALEIILITLIIFSGCTKSDEDNKEHSMSGMDEGQVVMKQIDYDSLRLVLNELSDSVSHDMMNVEHRMTLVEAAYDTATGSIFSVGSGTLPIDAETPAIAMKYAERAAKLQALRMAANIKTWSLYPTRMDTMPMDVALPPATIVSKDVSTDSTINLLVKIDSQGIR